MNKLIFLILIFTFANVFAEEAKPKCHLGYKVIDGIKPCTGYIGKSTINSESSDIGPISYKKNATGIDFKFYNQDGVQVIPKSYVSNRKEYSDPKKIFFDAWYVLEGKHESSVIFALDKKFQIENIRPIKNRPLKYEKFSKEEIEKFKLRLIKTKEGDLSFGYDLKESKPTNLIFYRSEFEDYYVVYVESLRENEIYENHKLDSYRYLIYNKDNTFIGQYRPGPGEGEAFFNPLFKFSLYGIEYLLASDSDYLHPLVGSISLLYRINGKTYWSILGRNMMLPFDLDKK